MKEADEFSWDEEAGGETPFSDGGLSDSGVGSAFGGKDPFDPVDFSPRGGRAKDGGPRSRSALGDPTFERRAAPVRSKTALGQPGCLDVDFDPLASRPGVESAPWRSNEDLLNENLGTGTGAHGRPTTNGAHAHWDPFRRPALWGSPHFANNNNNNEGLSRRERTELDLALALGGTSSQAPAPGF